MMEIARWLEGLGLGKYAAAFADAEIELDALPDLTEGELEKLGIPLGPRKRLLRAIASLETGGAGAQAAALPATPRSEAERRHLTVLFADLVGSTAMAHGADPEEVARVLRGFQDAAAGAITRYEGHVAKFMGDGVLAYFGYPRAHEDDAERAVRAGLALVQAVRGLAGSLQVRIGIATGLVVVGEILGEGGAREETAVGETLNLAARLQAEAKPGAVLIAPSTRALLAEVFELEPLGPRELKGIAGTVEPWRVLGERAAESRFEASRGQRLNRLVGRDQELALALARFDQAKAGEGQVVLLRAEPGIGKSRLVAELRSRLEPQASASLRYQCSPHHVNSALYPVIQQLTRAAAIAPGDEADARMAKLATLAAHSGVEASHAVPLLAPLLSIPSSERYPTPDMTPQQQKAATLALLADLLAGLARSGPVLMVVEDLHWVDPTTRELLDLIVGQVETLQALLLLTFRPEIAAPWEGRGHVTPLTLNRLGRAQTEALIAATVGTKTLPPEVVEQIAAKTDGVPLYIEELTKTVLESGLLRDAGDRYDLAGPLPALAVPSSLQASLAARLDRLAPVREVAQIGAALGREFDFDLLVAVAPYGERQLAEALAELQRAELVFPRGLPPRTTWVFKHALIQDAAYETLLKSSRTALHARIAGAIETRFPALAEAEPERLAQHWSEAGSYGQAATSWAIAGDRAATRMAGREALAHYAAAITALDRTGSPSDRRRRGELNLKRSSLLFQIDGYVSAAAENAALEAEQDADAVGAIDLSVRAKISRATASFARSQYRPALTICTTVSDITFNALATASKELYLMGLGVCHYGLGEYIVARQHLSAAIDAGGDSPTSEPSAGGAIPTVVGRTYLAHTLALLGYADRAAIVARENVEMARRLGHPYSIAWASYGLTRTMCMVGRWSDAIRSAREGLELSRRYSWVARLGTLLIFQGWAKARCGLLEEGIADMEDGLAAWTKTSGNMSLSMWLIDLADAVIGTSRLSLAREWIRRARQIHDSTDQRSGTADLLRLEAELAQMDRDYDVSETLYRQALSVSAAQSVRLPALRAATSLAGLLVNRNRTHEARAVLAPIYAWFTEGFDTPTLKDAKSAARRTGMKAGAGLRSLLLPRRGLTKSGNVTLVAALQPSATLPRQSSGIWTLTTKEGHPMKVVVIFHRKEGTKPEDFQPLVEAEDKHGFALYRDDVLREVYHRADGKGAIAMLECDSVEHARKLIEAFPMVEAGLLDVDVYGAVPYRAIAQLAG